MESNALHCGQMALAIKRFLGLAAESVKVFGMGVAFVTKSMKIKRELLYHDKYRKSYWHNRRSVYITRLSFSANRQIIGYRTQIPHPKSCWRTDGAVFAAICLEFAFFYY